MMKSRHDTLIITPRYKHGMRHCLPFYVAKEAVRQMMLRRCRTLALFAAAATITMLRELQRRCLLMMMTTYDAAR